MKIKTLKIPEIKLDNNFFSSLNVVLYSIAFFITDNLKIAIFSLIVIIYSLYSYNSKSQ